MTTLTATRIVEFDAGHRVRGHEGKCKHLHGHRYKVELHARTKPGIDFDLDDVGRKVDFGVLKERVGGWIDEEWDHRLLLWDRDATQFVDSEDMIGVVRVPFNPTAENIARHLVEYVCPDRLEGLLVEVYYDVVWETPNCFATATKEQ